MQHDSATTAVRTNLPQIGVARRYQMKNWNESRMKERPRKELRLLSITTKNQDRTVDRNNGLEARISREETTIVITTGLGEIPPNNYQNSSPRPNIAYGNNRPDNGRSFDQRPNRSSNRNDGNRSGKWSFNNSNEDWLNNGNFFRSRLTQRRDFSQKNSYRQPRSDQPNNFTFRRSDNRPSTGFTSYDQKFPQNNNQTSSNVVRLTTTDDTINELSGLCPLNY